MGALVGPADLDLSPSATISSMVTRRSGTAVYIAHNLVAAAAGGRYGVTVATKTSCALESPPGTPSPTKLGRTALSVLACQL
jgi:hypothetical protein